MLPWGLSYCSPVWDVLSVSLYGIVVFFVYGMLCLLSFVGCSYCFPLWYVLFVFLYGMFLLPCLMKCSYCFPLWVGPGAFGGRSLRISHMLSLLNMLEIIYILTLLNILFIRGRIFKVFLIFVSSSCHSTLILCKSIKIDKQKLAVLLAMLALCMYKIAEDPKYCPHHSLGYFVPFL